MLTVLRQPVYFFQVTVLGLSALRFLRCFFFCAHMYVAQVERFKGVGRTAFWVFLLEPIEHTAGNEPAVFTGRTRQQHPKLVCAHLCERVARAQFV